MNATSPLGQALLYLAAMVLAVPLFKRLGLGAVLGYLAAGAALGPYALGWLGGTHGEVLHLAEFGVIMMLFLIGLELKPSVLWKLRGPIFGWGGMQVAGTAAMVLALAAALGQDWRAGLVTGLILAMSSTAIVIQTLQERGLMKTTGGEAAFSVLLFQDIAVIPVLAVIPLLATQGAPLPEAAGESSGLMQAARILGAIGTVIAAGRFLVKPIFALVARSHLREIFTALALLLVLATTALMELAGLSPALGAFMAGVLLADSPYRHQLEADIEPFKGLLLGVFFISVGAGLDLGAAAATPLTTLADVAGLILIKAFVITLIARLVKLPNPARILFAAALAQGGEFAFVLVNFAGKHGTLAPGLGQRISTAVALSMAAAPLIIGAYARFIEPRYATKGAAEREPDAIDERDNQVIVAGFGRFGQMVTRLLRSCGVKTTVLDHDAEQVEVLQRFGLKSFYGDASRMDLLHSAGAAQARLLILAIDDAAKTTEIVEAVQKEFPRLKILARVYDRIHAYELMNKGVEHVYVETAGSALRLGTEALKQLGFSAKQALRSAQLFERTNNRSIQELAKIYEEADDNTFITHSKAAVDQLQKIMETELAAQGPGEEAERAWESAPRL